MDRATGLFTLIVICCVWWEIFFTLLFQNRNVLWCTYFFIEPVAAPSSLSRFAYCSRSTNGWTRRKDLDNHSKMKRKNENKFHGKSFERACLEITFKIFVVHSQILLIFLSIAHGNKHCTTDVMTETNACYWMEGAERWHRTLVECLRKGGTLAVVNSIIVHEFLNNASLLTATGVWIGACEGILKGTYHWTNGRLLTWTRWRNEKPDRPTIAF